jgi:hypothetical protein
MTTAIARSSASLAVPHSQNTAPVHEHRCLYSHDIRRKQKRWQDGFVKFHTFNKRVMVYDEGRNFLGDTHWKEQGALQADDEVTLDMGILVQVGDMLATSQTNLAPLFEREKKRPECADGDGNEMPTPARATLGVKANATPSGFQKHRSLNALLGTPKGVLGRSKLPIKSPYEMRNTNNENEWEDGQGVKRRKVDQPWAVTRVTKEMPLWARTSDARKKISQKSKSDTPIAGQRGLMNKEVVDITSDNEGDPNSDVTPPITPAKEPVTRAVPKIRPVAKTPAPWVSKPSITPRWEAPSSPPVSARNHLKSVDPGTTVQMTRSSRTETTVKDNSLPDTEEHSEAPRPKSAPRVKPLRLIKSQPRPMLLCQNSTPTAAERSQLSRKSHKRTNTAKSVEPTTEPTLLQTLIAARKPRKNPFAGLSDSDEDVVLSRDLPKTVQPAATDRVLSHTSASETIKSRAAVLASDGTSRSSSPAFSTLPPRPENFEPLQNADPVSLLPGITKQKQRREPLSESSGVELIHGAKDQQLLTYSNVHALASNPPPPAMPQQNPTTNSPIPPPQNAAAKPPIPHPPKPKPKSPFRRVQSESNAKPKFDTLTISSPIPQPESIAAVLRPSQERLLKKVSTASKRAPRKPLQRSISLATSTTEKLRQASYGKAKLFEKVPEKKTELGPWTIEATDLFDWRPPDWDGRVERRKEEFGY